MRPPALAARASRAPSVGRLGLLLFALLVGAALAGCAEPAATEHFDDLGGVPADDLGTEPTLDDAPADSGASDDSGEESAADSWDAFADFDREVTPRSGGAGLVRSFDYRHTTTERNETTILDVHVDVLEPAVEDVRAQKMWMADGGFQTEVVSTPVELRATRHTITVVQDDTGDYEAGHAYTVTYYRAVDPADGEHGFNGYFVKAHVQNADSEGWVEYYVTPEMEAEAEAQDASYTIFTEGDVDGDWWGHAYLLSVYGSGMWYTYAQDAEYQEDEWSYAGTSSSMKRATLEVGAYTFDGWRYETRSEFGDDFALHGFEVATGLPIPVSYRIEGESGGRGSLMLYELTDLVLG